MIDEPKGLLIIVDVKGKGLCDIVEWDELLAYVVEAGEREALVCLQLDEH